MKPQHRTPLPLPPADRRNPAAVIGAILAQKHQRRNHASEAAMASPAAVSAQAPAPTRIRFRSGATSGIVSGQLAPRGARSCILRAMAGQTMRVAIGSPNANIYLTVVGADGLALKSYDDWSAVWEGVLLTSQDYYLLPIAVGSDTRLTLTVRVSPLGQTTPPARICFAAGGTSGTVSGHTPSGGRARYVLWVARGQRMELRT